MVLILTQRNAGAMKFFGHIRMNLSIRKKAVAQSAPYNGTSLHHAFENSAARPSQSLFAY
jgi:hypothetical protein